MRRLFIVLFALLLLAACATSHFEDVVRVAASKHPRECTTPYTVTKLNGWGYRVDACEGPLFYRCSYARKTMGRTQCCDLVADEAAATALLSAAPGESATCLEFVD